MRMISLYKIHFSSFHIKVIIIIILTIVIDITVVIILSLLSWMWLLLWLITDIILALKTKANDIYDFK